MIRTRSKTQEHPSIEKLAYAAGLVAWLVKGVQTSLMYNPSILSIAEENLKEMLQCLDFEHVFVNAGFDDANPRILEIEVVLKDWDQDPISFIERFLLAP